MLKNVLFCHDHQLLEVEGQFYSAGKLDYSKFTFYLDIFDSFTLVTRSKCVESVVLGASLVSGPNVRVQTLPNLASPKGLVFRNKIKKRLTTLIKEHDGVIARLPSEIGLMALEIAKDINKPVLVEVVANAYDCLKYRGDLFAKIYAPILEWRMGRACLNADVITYVTEKYLQQKYPSTGCQTAISDAGIGIVLPARAYPNVEVMTVGIIGNPDVVLKGIKVAFDAILHIREFFNINLVLRVLGGEGEAFITDNGPLPAWCNFDGVLVGQDKVNAWLDNVDFYIQPSFTEGLPRSLVEAMSRGIPCLGSNVGGIPELLPSQCLFSPGKTDELVKCLLELINNKDNYESTASACSKKAIEYDKTVLLDKRTSFYKQFSKGTF